MKKNNRFAGRIWALILTSALWLGSVPVSAQEDFSSWEDAELQADIPEENFSEEIQEMDLTENGTVPDTQQEGGETDYQENSAEIFEEPFDAQEAEVFEEGSAAEDFSSPEEEDETFGDGTDEADEEGIRYIKGRPLTEEEIAQQLAPIEQLTPLSPAPEVESDLGISAYALFPETFDARAFGYITSVKNQNPFGLCWGFAMASLLETSLLIKGQGVYDLSEEHLGYFFANRQNDPLGNTPKDINTHLGMKNGQLDYHEGGNDVLASYFLSTWSGMTTEEDVPLPTDSTHTQVLSVTPDLEKAYHTAAYLENAAFSDYSIERMKLLLSEYYSVSIMYNMLDNYYNANTAAYCYPVNSTTKTVNHVVTVVGWDDTYSKENFAASSGVTSDGAWIVKNSWDSNWGDEGYFYLSYEDKSISSLVCAQATTEPKYTNNYFYDGSSGGTTAKLNPGKSVAVVFTAKAGNGNSEALGEVVAATYSDNSEYEIQIYTGLKNTADPTSGTPVYDTPISCSQPIAGVNTISVPEVTLMPNTIYSVVLTNIGDNTIDYAYERDFDCGWAKFTAGTETGQGFAKTGTLWTDMASYGACPRLKAHTRTMDAAVSLQLTDDSFTLKTGESRNVGAVLTTPDPDSRTIVYTSSNTDVATVDATGLVTAKGAGITVITCESSAYLGLKVTCTITVQPAATPAPTATPVPTSAPAVSTPIPVKAPAAPTGIKASAPSYNKIKLTWNGSEGSEGYVLYRQQSGQQEKEIAAVSAKTTSYTDSSLKLGTTYKYRIRAYNTSGEKRLYSTYSMAVSKSPALGIPSVTVRASSGMYNTLTWKKISGAHGYYVYRRIPGKKWTRIAVIKDDGAVSYQDKKITSLTSYNYAVRAYRVVNGKKVLSSYKATSTIKASPAKQKISSITSQSNGLIIRWSAQKKASGYRIYRKTAGGSWKVIKDITKPTTTSYVDKTAKKGITYTYCVRAYVKEPYGRLYSKYVSKKAVRK